MPQRARPLAMVHSKVARLRSVQAMRTMRTARSSSIVSMTTMGVEELMRTFRRSMGLWSGVWDGVEDGLAGEFISLLAHIYFTGCELLP